MCMLSLLITIVEILMFLHVYEIFIKEYFPHIESNTIDLH